MKTRKTMKKLVLKRETISNLGEGMKNIAGGGFDSGNSCLMSICLETCVCPSIPITCEPCPESLDTCVSCLWIGTMCQAW